MKEMYTRLPLETRTQSLVSFSAVTGLCEKISSCDLPERKSRRTMPCVL